MSDNNFKVILEDELQRKIPDFQKGNPELDQFLEAAGQYLDHVRAQIDGLKHTQDYHNSTFEQLVNFTEQELVEFPLTIPEEVLRLVARDIATVYRNKGTEETIKWIFKVMGLGVSVRYAWILNPETFEIPPQEDIGTTTFIYGRERVYDNGVYFDGEDIFGTSYEKYPIVGESYPKNAKRIEDNLGRTPYIFLNIDNEDYEQFRLDYDLAAATDLDRIIIDFFDIVRPANVVLVIVITAPDFEDPVDDRPSEELSKTIDYPVVNNGFWQLGTSLNHFRFGEYFKAPLIEQDSTFEYINNRENFDFVPQDQFESRHSSANDHRWIHIRDHALVTFNSRLVNGSVDVEFSADDRWTLVDGTPSWETFYSTEWDVEEGYETDVTQFGNSLFGTTPWAGSSDNGGDWIQERSFSDIFIDKSALRTVFSSDINGYVEMDVHYFSMLHPTILSPKFETAFERASTARNIDESGTMVSEPVNTLRDAYSFFESDVERVGYLVEEEKTNLVLRSQSFSSFPWQQNQGGSAISTTQTFIDGTSMFFVIRNEGSSNFAGLYQDVSGIEQGIMYGASVYTRQGNANRMTFYVEQGTHSSTISFDPTLQSIEEIQGEDIFPNTSIHFERVEEDIYRLIFTFETVSTDDIRIYLVADIDNIDLQQFTYFFGPQLEKGSVTSYIRTQSEPVTRSSDDMNLPFVPESLEQGGVILIDCSTISFDDSVLFEFTDGAESFKVRFDGDHIKLNGTNLFEVDKKSFVYDNNFYLCFQRSANDVLYWIEDDYGKKESGSVPYPSFTPPLQLSIGSDINNSNHINGSIRNLYFSTDDYSDELSQWIRDIMIEYRNLQHK